MSFNFTEKIKPLYLNSNIHRLEGKDLRLSPAQPHITLRA